MRVGMSYERMDSFYSFGNYSGYGPGYGVPPRGFGNMIAPGPGGWGGWNQAPMFPPGQMENGSTGSNGWYR